MAKIEIYTDGSSLGNPGPGGYGVVMKSGMHRKELSGGFRLTTNNRMEILAAIEGLKALKNGKSHHVIIHSDSRLLCDTINLGWARRWKTNNWKRNKSDKALNPDLWEILLELTSIYKVEFKWIPGHAGIEENERCDQLSKQAAAVKNLPVDVEYEKSMSK